MHIHKVEFYQKSKARFDEDDEFKDRARKEVLALLCVCAVGLPAAFVPLPIGNGEQALNAHPVVQAGGGLLIDDEAMTPAWVDQVVVPLVQDTERLALMSAAATDLVPRDADARLARMVMAAAGRELGR